MAALVPAMTVFAAVPVAKDVDARHFAIGLSLSLRQPGMTEKTP
jgi:hypothetical protein